MKSFKVYKEDGSVDIVSYPEGSQLEKDVASSGVYQTNNPNEEQYSPVNQATADIDINPGTGTITVTGPKWLTSEIVNSDSFKQNYSENESLLKMVNLFRSDPTASVQDSTGQTISVADTLKKYQDSASALGKQFAQIVAFKDENQKKYGVDFTDKDVAIASNFLNKADYNNNDVVYVPDWAMGKANWSSVASWDKENRTVSASDFFKNIYTEDFENKVATDLQTESNAKLIEALANNVIPEGDESEEALKKKELLADENYASELARTMQMFRIVNNNRPETSALFDAAQFGASTIINFCGYVGEGAQNLSALITGFFDFIPKKLDEAGIETININLANPLYLIATLTGEAISFIQDGGDIKEWSAELQSDMEQILLKHNSYEVFTQKADEIGAYFDELNEKLSKVTGAWAAGEFVGEFLGVIFENIVLLNPAGKVAAGAVTKFAKSSASLMKVATFLKGNKFAVNTMKVLAATTNGLAQMSLEVLLEDRQLVEEALRSGEMSEELKDKMWQSFIFNSLPEVGPEVFRIWADNTTSGRATEMAIKKLMYGTKGAAGKAKHKILKSIFGDWAKDVADASVDATGRAVAKEAAAKTAVDNPAKLRRRNIALAGARSDAYLTISKIPILKEMSESQKKAIEYAWKTITGEEFGFGKDGEELYKEIQKLINDAEEEGAEAAVKKSERLGKIIEENHEMQKNVISVVTKFENEIDALSKGASIMQSKINAAAGETLTDYQEASNKVLKIEGANNSLTRRQGNFLTKETSEYLSAKTQGVRYQNKIDKVAELVETKKMSKNDAIAHLFGRDEAGNIVSSGKSEYKKAKEYLGYLQKTMADNAVKMGSELVSAADDMFGKMAKYTKAIDDFMIKNGYYTGEQAAKIAKWRSEGYWGPDGENFIHTARLFDGEDSEKAMKEFAKRFSNPAQFNIKSLSDDPHYLKAGNMESSFVDPMVVLGSYLHSAAAAAQGQEWSRTIHALSIATKGIDGFKNTYKAKDVESYVTKSLKGLQKDFDFTAELGASKALTGEMSEISAALKESLEAKQTYVKNAKVSGALHEKANKAEKAYQAKREKVLGGVLTSNRTFASTVNRMSESEIDGLLAVLPKSAKVPNFDIGSLRAADYKAWKESLPEDVQKFINNRMKGRADNITNLKAVARESEDFIPALKSTWLKSDGSTSIRNNKAYKEYMMKVRENQLSIKQKTLLDKSRAEYDDAMAKWTEAKEKIANGKPNAKNPSSMGEEFMTRIESISDTIFNETISSMKKNTHFNKLVDDIMKSAEEKGIAASKDEIEGYVALKQLEKVEGKKFQSLLLNNAGGKEARLIDVAAKTAGKSSASAGNLTNIANAIGNGIKENLTSELDELEGTLINRYGMSEILDVDSYWTKVQNEMDKIQEFGLFRNFNKKTGKEFVDYDRGRIIQMVDESGEIRFYQTSPLYASLANVAPNLYYKQGNKFTQALERFNQRVNALFRFGTTGIDRSSYMNQWFRDPMAATVKAGALPFTDLSVGGPLRTARAIAGDYTPFSQTRLGKKIFGDNFTAKFTDSFVESTFKETEEGIAKYYGESVLEDIRASATKGLSGEKAEAAYKRAVVEYAVGDNGMAMVPGMGGITEARFYRGEGKYMTTSELKREELMRKIEANVAGVDESAFGKTIQNASNKLGDMYDNFLENASRGNWRESYMRQKAYAKSYKTAIESGMTMQEARIWAERFALDATTDFGRTFEFANQFIKNVPYFGAAINGNRSFMRLLLMDPIGISSRFTFGMALPYMSMLTECLDDEDNAKVYAEIPEWEKENSMIFVNRGAVIKIPIPQEMAGFLAPFRQTVEKSHDLNDESWLSLISSDALMTTPINLSGFLELGPNDLLSETGEYGLWDRIGRGTEKAASSLMGPLTKSAYMLMSGRDPYTGDKIDKSYVTINDEGETEIMDSTKSKIALKLHEIFPSLSASAAYSITKTLMGRSTLSVLDGFAGMIEDGVRPQAFFDQAASEFEKPFDVPSLSYSQAKSDWNDAINLAYKKREELVNDPELQKALTAMRSSSGSDTKKDGARQTYKNKVDEYYKFVLDISNAMKEKYPDSFTDARLAQVISVMTLPTGINANDTAYSEQLQKDAYYDAKNAAISTFLKMGFPTDTAGNNILGTGYYDNNGEYQFKVNTPYEIQYYNNLAWSTSDQFSAMIESDLKKADINRGDMWDGYYKADDKASRKEYKDDWNARVVSVLYPTISRYGVNTVLNDSATRDLLDNYLFVDNPYKTKDFLYKIFGGDR